MSDEDFIQRTFELARNGLGTTWPNPLVGAVIVKNNKVIGEGFHRKKGSHHAELDALKNCQESPEGATLYVNLEPCCHTNKTTPPCAQRLIQEKIKKVVICNLDPNPAVNGKGMELLESNGIEVVHGVLGQEGEKLNEVFFHAQRSKKPFIHFKTAMTMDGKTAMNSGESKWITGERARAHVHELRSVYQGIIVGGETVRKDNPKLTVRTPGYMGPNPVRIVFTKSGNLPAKHHLFTDELSHTTLIYTENKLSFNFPAGQVVTITNLNEALDDLYSKNLIALMLESGPNLTTEFMKQGFVERVSLYQNPSFLGEGKGILNDLGLKELAKRPYLTQIESSWLGEDLYLTGRFKG